MNYYDSAKDDSITTVIGLRKEAVYVYIPTPPTPPTPFLGEWIGLAEKDTGMITAIGLSKESLFLNLEKDTLMERAEIEQMTTVTNLLKESVFLQSPKTSCLYESQAMQSLFLKIKTQFRSICD